MLRRALTTLFCSLALVAPAFSQDVFVPRELKAVPVHPLKPKEVVRRAEPVTDADLKAPPPGTESVKSKAQKTEPAPAKTEKVAKADASKEKSDKPSAPKEKPAVTKAPPAADDVATIKVGKAPATKTVAKTETAKDGINGGKNIVRLTQRENGWPRRQPKCADAFRKGNHFSSTSNGSHSTNGAQ